jgi:hypothetical protein
MQLDPLYEISPIEHLLILLYRPINKYDRALHILN